MLQIGNVHGKTNGHTSIHTILCRQMLETHTLMYTVTCDKYTLIIRFRKVFNRCLTSHVSTQIWTRCKTAGETGKESSKKENN